MLFHFLLMMGKPLVIRELQMELLAVENYFIFKLKQLVIYNVGQLMMISQCLNGLISISMSLI